MSRTHRFSSASARRAACSGFSMLELLVVVVIIAVLVAIAIPSSVTTAGSLASAIGVASLTTLSASSSTQAIKFDARGAVS